MISKKVIVSVLNICLVALFVVAADKLVTEEKWKAMKHDDKLTYLKTIGVKADPSKISFKENKLITTGEADVSGYTGIIVATETTIKAEGSTLIGSGEWDIRQGTVLKSGKDLDLKEGTKIIAPLELKSIPLTGKITSINWEPPNSPEKAAFYQVKGLSNTKIGDYKILTSDSAQIHDNFFSMQVKKLIPITSDDGFLDLINQIREKGKVAYLFSGLTVIDKDTKLSRTFGRSRTQGTIGSLDGIVYTTHRKGGCDGSKSNCVVHSNEGARIKVREENNIFSYSRNDDFSGSSYALTFGAGEVQGRGKFSNTKSVVVDHKKASFSIVGSQDKPGHVDIYQCQPACNNPQKSGVHIGSMQSSGKKGFTLPLLGSPI